MSQECGKCPAEIFEQFLSSFEFLLTQEGIDKKSVEHPSIIFFQDEDAEREISTYVDEEENFHFGLFFIQLSTHQSKVKH